jgi:hypothetical protein
VECRAAFLYVEWLRACRRRLLIRRDQTTVSMRFRAWLPGAKLTFLARLCAASGAPHRQCLFRSSPHDCIMMEGSAVRWSILISVESRQEKGAQCACGGDKSTGYDTNEDAKSEGESHSWQIAELQIVERNGEDDGTRTRSLCRDRVTTRCN